ncbi:MAG: PEGA domain-containing protein [Bacteroidales bacterium]|nr:PEGA domain-containing protein [Bacteroidales bacterium]
MKRFFILVIALLLSFNVLAQIMVKPDSFREVPGFVNVNRDKMYDDNDKPYAVLKIRTEKITDKQRRELLFQGDAQTFFEVEYNVGEVWLYLSYYASYIKISHPDLSSTEFVFPYDMKPKCGYELTLVNKWDSVVDEKIEYNYLIVRADQPHALIYLDDAFVGEKEVSKSYPTGETHKWRIECDYYHAESGVAEIIAGDPIAIDKKLRPAYGYINVTSEPESGAMVFIDGNKVGVTPCKSDRLKSGSYSVKVVKEMYNTMEQTVMVTDGNTTNASIKMTANFVDVNITTDLQSDIYIDNEKKGKGSWKGRLSDGTHIFEAKKESHKTSTKNVTLVRGKSENIVIPDPTPIYGILDVNSRPMGATIFIDGKKIGTTPRVITDILIGKHTIRIEKDGYNTDTKEITIIEKKKTDLNVTLSVGKEITIETNGSGDHIFVDGKEIGTSPLKTALSYGKHTISAYNGNKSAMKDILVERNGGIDKVHLVLEKETLSSYAETGYKFLTLNASVNQYSDLSYGVTLGSMKKFGWFVSATTNFGFGTSYDFECDADHYVGNYYPEYTGTESFSSLSLMGGLLMRLDGAVALRLGAGFGMRMKRYETVSGYWVKNTDISAQGLDLSLGLQCNFRGFIVSLDCVTTSFKTFEAKIGLGYGLKNK